MLQNLSDRHSDVKNVIIYNTRRLTRDIDSFSKDIGSILVAHRVQLHSATEQMDDTPQDRFIWTLSIALGYSPKKVAVGQARNGKVKERLTLERNDNLCRVYI